jgi:sugar fermentation stimulation protein A
MRSFSLFPKVKQGRFIRRLNRFTVECSLDGEIVRAHLPNPGRLWELLLPGRIVSLVSNDPLPGRSTAYTAVAVMREGMPVLLHTQKSNAVVKYLLEKNKIRGLEHARIIKQEAAFGTSRFDFLLQKENAQYVVEVKSCTLFGKRIAMFPDAVTERGRRHLLKLSELTDIGMSCGVIFVVHWPLARFFLPDYHTDFAFARTFFSLKDRLIYRAVSVTWRENLTLGEDVRELEIPWEVLNREAVDSGSYMLILHLLEDITISVGSLGHVTFSRGFYI